MSGNSTKDHIIIIGLNHRTAPVEIREKLAFAKKEVDPLNLFLQVPVIREVLFLSTCNRVEIILVTRNPEAAPSMIKEVWGKANHVEVNLFDQHLYYFYNQEAVRHIFKVASGLDSLVLGEPQILGQLKDAYRQAAERRATGVILNRLLHKTFSVAKRIRSETGIGSHAVSVSYAAVELAKKIFGELRGKQAMLIGAGEMAELAAQHLLSHGVENLVVANRTLSRAIELAKHFKGEAISLDELEDYLLKVDIVISSTGAPHYIIDKNQVKKLMRPRKMRPLFFIDIAVPRDIDPAVNDIENVFVYDIDDLKTVIEENLAFRRKEAIKAERIIEEEVIKFTNWLEQLEIYPTIVALRQKAEEIRKKELEKTLSHLKTKLSDEDREAIEILTKSLVNKLLHDPIIYLKNRYHKDGQLVVDFTRKIFNLDGDRPLEIKHPPVYLPENEKEKSKKH
ncbi:glutamyl-tRNA reductase [Thermodesulfatator indicus DSM 15286]|uniref:Glutamyl-tRNA reductase n=1 Tax=Thermodesulfatator indicus (strain DSM 15286 / JCM 11887 / CIR29812) TaxID=667014 RepID=F8A990_THEID|nr:glutamyl-tRNA reductase [Thermodesulfatator indicus]AEH45280.1 glutamyl-tRNA reductase [Thermodesulfatator indicus DSM 15286]